MKRCMTGLVSLMAGGLLCANAPGEPQEPRFVFQAQRFVLEEHGLPLIGVKDGKPYQERAPILIKLDTATGRVWRYSCERTAQDGKTAQTVLEAFVSVPVEGLAEDKADQLGRFQIVDSSLRMATTSDGILKAYQGNPAVLVLDGTTGRVWAYRGERQYVDGKTLLKEAFVLIRDSDPPR
jgi:hypothetical protein